MTTSIAESVIDFLGNLQGMDHLISTVEQQRKAVIDLNTAAIIEADPDFPEGDVLLYERADGLKSVVHTRKLIETIFLRHAQQASILEGGTVREHYEHISNHFQTKTTYGL